MDTLLTGGTGFVGKYLFPMLDECSIYVTSRNRDRANQKLKGKIADAIEWNPLATELQLDDSLPNFDAVINLMGEPIAEGRWTPDKKQRIRDSRVLGTQRLVTAMLGQERPPSVFVSASAVGIYGDGGEQVLDESAPLGTGFLTDVCQEWEAATQPLIEAGTRVVLIRIGIVLGKDGGAISGMLPIFKWGLGGRLGNGRQFFPWIHVEDLARMIHWALINESVSGVLNGTAPNPVTNAEFTKALANALRRPAFLPAPRFGLRLLLGEFADSLFSSQRVVPRASLDQGFEFHFTEVRDALSDLL